MNGVNEVKWCAAAAEVRVPVTGHTNVTVSLLADRRTDKTENDNDDNA